MIKKIFLGLSFVALLTACTDDYKDWVTPETVAQPEQVSFADGSVSAVDVIRMADLADGQQTIKVCNLTAPSASGGDFTPRYTISFGDKVFDLNADGSMNVSDLKQYVESVFGKAPTERSLDATVSMWLENGSTSVKTASSQPFPVKVVLSAPFIDSGYWLVGDMASWDAAGAMAFTHLGSGDVYDAPEFQIVFTTTADNQYWKIIPQGNYDGDFWAGGNTGVLGTVVDGDTSMQGTLTTDNPQAGKIEQAGIYRMTINMMEYTYTIEKLEFAPYVYFIGATDGWQQAEQKLATVNFDGIYTGYIYCADPNGWGNAFKFQKVAGNWDTQINAGTLTGGINGDFTYDGNSDQNIVATAGEGIYYITLDLANNSITATRINNMNLVGDFNGWNAADDVQQMTWDAENYCYVITGAGVNANGWKFTANNDWGINLGGNDTVEPSMKIDDLAANGKNLGAVGTTIKLYPTRRNSDKIYCTVE